MKVEAAKPVKSRASEEQGRGAGEAGRCVWRNRALEVCRSEEQGGCVLGSHDREEPSGRIAGVRRRGGEKVRVRVKGVVVLWALSRL